MALTPRLVSGSSAKRPEPSGINAMLRVQQNSTGQPWIKSGHGERLCWPSLRVTGVPVGVAQHAAGQRAGVLAFLVKHLAVDDRGEDALGRLLDAPGALWEIADDDLVAAFYGRRVEDHDVGGHAGMQQPAVVNSEGRGRVEGQPAHRLLQTHDL